RTCRAPEADRRALVHAARATRPGLSALLERAELPRPDPGDAGATATTEDLIACCKVELGSVKVPKSIDYVTALPKAPSESCSSGICARILAGRRPAGVIEPGCARQVTTG